MKGKMKLRWRKIEPGWWGSHSRIFVVESMGRRAGWPALEKPKLVNGDAYYNTKNYRARD